MSTVQGPGNGGAKRLPDPVRHLVALVFVVGWWQLGTRCPAAVYEVGEGKPFVRLADVPWARLGPGDEVRIHARREPYRERILLMARGRPGQPVRVVGVPDNEGQLPVIDGAGAEVPAGMEALWNGRSVVQVGDGDRGATEMPEHLELVGLEIRGGRPPNQFRDSKGRWIPYRPLAAAVYVARGRHLRLVGCRLRDSGNGLLVGSSDLGASAHIEVEGCEIYGNGNLGSLYEHNVYTAAQGVVFLGNYLGPLAAGALGNNLKDRSSGLVLVANWIEGGSRQLDLVNAENSRWIRQDPGYREALVLNNVLVEPDGAGNRQVVQFGGDTGPMAQYRQGLLRFWQNTVVSYRRDRAVLFKVSVDGATVEARNNLFHAAVPGGGLAVLEELGGVEWGTNWISQGWRGRMAGRPRAWTSTAGLRVGVDPGVADVLHRDFRLRPGAAAAHGAEPWPEEWERRWGGVRFHPRVEGRVASGSGVLGARRSGGR